VYFNIPLSPESGYFRLRISDSKLEGLIDLKKVGLFLGPFNSPWAGLGPGDIPLLSRGNFGTGTHFAAFIRAQVRQLRMSAY
jgi:hypothetical protein